MKRIILLLTLTSLLFTGCAQLGTTPAATEKAPALTAIKFHKDSCGTCQKMDAFLPAVEQSFAGKPVRFVEFDRTDAKSQAATGALADSLGLEAVLRANPGSGYLLLVDEKGRVVKKLSGKEYAQAEMIDEIGKQLP